MVAAGSDAFKRDIPLEVPKLATFEEFLVVRAKRRPVLLVQPESPALSVDNKGYRGKVQRKRSLVAQVFGLADAKTLQPDFSSSFVERVRKMEFPQLLFLPKKAGLFEVDSLLRLDELQSVFTPHLEGTRFCFGSEMLEVLIGQIQFFFAGVGPNHYTELREELLKS